MKKIFKTQLNAAVIVLIPACIGINYLGKLFASFLKLPLWLDSIGTCIGADRSSEPSVVLQTT